MNGAYRQVLGLRANTQLQGVRSPGRNTACHLPAHAKPSSSLGRQHSTSQRGFVCLSYGAHLPI